jgi:hypothetical protein
MEDASSARHSVSALFALFVLLLTLCLATYPDFAYLPASSQSGTLSSSSKHLQNLYVILDDDVMITMRVAKIFLRQGRPSFNRSDLSQPATSYALPLAAALLFKILPDNLALLASAAIGFALTVFTGFLIARSKDRFSAAFLFALWLLNSATLSFIFTGWEFLWQSFFVVAAWSLPVVWAEPTASKAEEIGQFVLIGVLAACAILFRIESVFLLSPLLLWLCLSRRSAASLLPGLLCLLLCLIYAYFQYHWFGRLTPTTARLKAGQLPPLSYSLPYLWSICKIGGSATFIPLLLASYFAGKPGAPSAQRPALFALAGIAAAFAFSFAFSDVYAAGRMFMATLALALLVASRTDIELGLLPKSGRPRLRQIAALLMLLGLSLALVSQAKERILGMIVRPYSAENPSHTIQQLMLANYLKTKLSPQDGAIGLFYAGTISFYMMDYEIADFLGKADEAIATTKQKWGPPGHNKWDTEISLKKWNPAVVPFPESIAAVPRAQLLEDVKNQQYYSFFEDYAVALPDHGYVFCKPFPQLDFGIFVRKDLLPRFNDCSRPLEPSTRPQATLGAQ